MEEKTLDQLAEEEFDARMVVEGLGMMNMYGRSHEESKNIAVDYARARANHAAAKFRLEEAIRKFAMEPAQ